MKSLIKNYVSKLSKEKLDNFAKKNDIILNENEINYLLNLIKNNIDDLLKNDKKYLSKIKNNISNTKYEKIYKLYTYYKNKYKDYLF